ncbi:MULTISPECIES: hypothetical protein [Sorangium]|uniref:Uncharacterized protein n=1 Tax=Sorangium cellulosum TaxID=56 RepID=A0A4P2QV12_SORCE|nr:MULTISPECIES: hypothetical protein [Sorangium]AUX34257.1 uncharacterized protein SOCE836_064280 [Sorangium cellulosum]WCQ93575.1 hypothetical protein NQZ70_06326 [Sorangium sp. Soce836]
MALPPSAQIDASVRGETPGDGNPPANALGRVYTTQRELTQVALLDEELARQLAAEATRKAAEEAAKKAPGALSTLGPAAGGATAGAGVWGLLYGAIGLVGISRTHALTEDALTDPSHRPMRTPFLGLDMGLDLRAAPRLDSNVQVRRPPCLVGRHGDLKKVCKLLPGEGSQSHHIVPDEFVRSGTRNGAAYRILSEDDGAAICIPGNAFVKGTLHNAIHADLNRILSNKVAAGESTDGTLPLSDVIGSSLRVTIAYKPECTAQIIREVRRAFQGIDTSQRVKIR